MLNSKIIDEFLKIGILNNNVELEFIYGSHYITKLNREQFINLIDYLNNNYNHLETINDLDIDNDFNSLSAALSNLNLFITASNSTAHLAGALGVKTLLIKPFNQATFFYWNQNTNRTPWYPSIELIETDIIYNKKLLIELVYSKLQ